LLILLSRAPDAGLARDVEDDVAPGDGPPDRNRVGDVGLELLDAEAVEGRVPPAGQAADGVAAGQEPPDNRPAEEPAASSNEGTHLAVLWVMTYRRYEVLLPLRFNDGSPVPSALIADTVRELKDRFGAASAETQTIRGLWENAGGTDTDDLRRVFIDVPDTAGNRDFFVAWKRQLAGRFQQDEVWMTTHPVEVVGGSV
jgi:hypothetical protein